MSLSSVWTLKLLLNRPVEKSFINESWIGRSNIRVVPPTVMVMTPNGGSMSAGEAVTAALWDWAAEVARA